MKTAITHPLIIAGLLCALPVAALEPSTAPEKPPRKDAGGAYRRPDFPVAAELPDPTRISESFREALERRMPAKSAVDGENGEPVAHLPDISLAASVCGHHQDMRHAMLRINGKIELVRPGDKLTLVAKDGMIEIQVKDIQPNQVHVLVMPANEELILH
jgi:hypothetical protein